MAGDEDLVLRVRRALDGVGGVHEVKMFGGIGFMLNGNMTATASKRGVMLRVGKDRQAEALARGARVVEMRGRPMDGYVRVNPADVNDAQLKEWVGLAVAFVRTLPPKTAKPPASRPKPARRR
jgi:TfoX/Sxy family transcriptional regulator of competence genes